MCKRNSICLSATLLLFALSAKSNRILPVNQKPNVVIIFTDDQRYDDIHALGNKQVLTPNIDKLVKGGVTFKSGYLQGANTGATCAPSRAQLLTGRGVFEIPKGDGKFFPATMVSIPMAFKDAGYYTYITGKSHNGPVASMRGFSGGAKLYGLTGEYYNPPYAMAYQDFREDGKYGKEHLYYVAGENFDVKLDPDENPNHVGPHNSEIFSKEAVDFIEGYNKSQPFLLYLPFHAPHDPRIAPLKYHEMYPPETIKLPVDFMPSHPFDNGELNTRDEKLAPFPRTVEDTRKQLSDYYAATTFLDEQIGKVLQAIKDKGIDDNTIIVFSSDSGLGMGSHGLFGKQNLYDDAGIHVPIIFLGPGIPKNKVRNDLCYTFDIFPTLCELANIPAPSSVTGKSLAGSILKNKIIEPRKELYFAYRGTIRAVRDERYKIIEYCVNGERYTQLFDLKNDPYELNNLAELAKYADILADYRSKLKAHKADEAEWGNEFWKTYLLDKK